MISLLAHTTLDDALTENKALSSEKPLLKDLAAQATHQKTAAGVLTAVTKVEQQAGQKLPFHQKVEASSSSTSDVSSAMSSTPSSTNTDAASAAANTSSFSSPIYY